ncbi:MAG: sensor histidine kinase [Tepidiformaceae bacterium]
MAALLVLTLVSAHRTTAGEPNLPAVTAAVGFAVVYGAGTVWERRRSTCRTARLGWLAAVLALWAALVVQIPEAAYLVFPLFFVALFLLGVWAGVAAVVLLATIAVVALGLHNGFTPAGVVGPAVGAVVALGLSAGVRALYRESQARREVIAELVATRSELASREREVGREAERARLAGEIHDTVAQGLSSIQLLLHAAERAGASGTALEHIRLARETAAEGLQETRQFIRELSPAALEGQSLVSALSRLAASSTRDGLEVSVHVSGDPDRLPMPLETTLLRIGQATLANVAQHAGASRAELTLTYLDDWVGLDVVDNGVGFDPSETRQPASFGLTALRERVEKLGGTLSIESSPGAGTAIAVGFSVERDEP